MKNNVLTILMAITMALVCVLVAVTFTNGINNEVSGSKDVVTVYGQGKISLEPDMAYLNFGYENIDIDPQKAQDDNAIQMSKIIDALIEKGILRENIQTVNFSVSEEYSNVNGSRVFTGYRVTNQIFVKIIELEDAGEIISTAFKSGGNVFSGIAFDVSNREEIYMQAVDVALAKAEEKAQAYAQKSDRKIIKILSIDEGNAPSNSYYSNYRSSSNSYLALSYARDRSGQSVLAAPSADAISTGQVEISATVTVIYELN